MVRAGQGVGNMRQTKLDRCQTMSDSVIEALPEKLDFETESGITFSTFLSGD
jgi:hypothetical protein